MEVNMVSMIKVFLGGTCNDSDWRDRLIPMLEIEYFNPVVEDWTPECQDEEIRQRKECDYCLYVITPRMIGVYSIAEVVDDSNKRPDKTLFCVLDTDGNLVFSEGQMKSLRQTMKMVANNGGTVFDLLNDVANFLNRMNEEAIPF
jgi:hypothetical protein